MLLNGIANSEICREILMTLDILTTAINDVIGFLEIKEIAWNAIPSADVSAMSEFKRVKNFAPGKYRQIFVRKQFTSALSDHSTLQEGRWIKPGMSNHSVAYVSVSANEAWCRTSNVPHTKKRPLHN